MLKPRWLILLLVLPAAACGDRVEAPEPRAADAWTDSLPPLPAGTIAAPLTLPLESALAALEAEIPRRFGNMERRIPAGPRSRSSYAFLAEREPFAVSFTGDTIRIASTIHYRGRGWYDPPIGPTLTGGCGEGDQRPRARLTFRVIAGLTPDWRLRTRIRLAGVTPASTDERDQCEVSVLKLDVTGKVLEAARIAIAKVLPTVDRNLAAIDVRSPLEGIWRELQEPIKVTDSLWLVLRPEAVSMGRLSAEGGRVSSRIGVRARPGFLTGPRPARRELPLPALGEGVAEAGFAMLVEGRFDYPVISGLLTQGLRGMAVETPGGVMRVRSIRVTGLGRGRVGLGLSFRGTAGGTVWLVGSPAYDAATRYITVPDLEFDASSAGLLIRGLTWLKGPEIRAFLRREARLPADSLLQALAAMAERETNRDLARGIRLGADITGAEPVGIHAGQRGIVLRALATGSARLELLPELFAPPAAKPATAPRASARSGGGAGLASESRRSPPEA